MKANQKYSVSATLRAMNKGDSFILPFDQNPVTAHVAARQLHAGVAVRKEAKGFRVFLTTPVPNGTEKVTYKIDKNVKLPESNRGRPTLVAAAAKAAKQNKNKKNTPVAKKSAPVKTAKKSAPVAKKVVVKTPAKRTAKPAKKANAPKPGKVVLGGKRVIAPAPPFAS